MSTTPARGLQKTGVPFGLRGDIKDSANEKQQQDSCHFSCRFLSDPVQRGHGRT